MKFIKKNGKAGVVKENGEIIIPAEYDKIGLIFGTRTSEEFEKKDKEDMNASRAILEKDDKVGYFDIKTKKWIIPYGEYDKIHFFIPFANGGEALLIVEKDGKKGILDCTSGKIILPCEYGDFVSGEDMIVANPECLRKLDKKFFTDEFIQNANAAFCKHARLLVETSKDDKKIEKAWKTYSKVSKFLITQNEKYHRAFKNAHKEDCKTEKIAQEAIEKIDQIVARIPKPESEVE